MEPVSQSFIMEAIDLVEVLEDLARRFVWYFVVWQAFLTSVMVGVACLP